MGTMVPLAPFAFDVSAATPSSVVEAFPLEVPDFIQLQPARHIISKHNELPIERENRDILRNFRE
jgi:hypothetical protein